MPFDRTQELQDAQAGEQQRRAELIRHLAAMLVPFAIMAVALFMLARALRKPNVLAAVGNARSGRSGRHGSPVCRAFPAAGCQWRSNPRSARRRARRSGRRGWPAWLCCNGVNPPNTYEVIEETFDANWKASCT